MNKNGTRQLAHIETKKKIAENKVSYFISATNAYDPNTGNEFIAVGNSVGEIHWV